MTRQSLSDQQMIDDLKSGRERLLSEPSLQPLLSALRRGLQSITRNIYVFRWIPEQGEDLYDVLVDGTVVVHVEVPRDASQIGTAAFQEWAVEEYLKVQTLAKHDRRKLELARSLARSGASAPK